MKLAIVLCLLVACSWAPSAQASAIDAVKQKAQELKESVLKVIEDAKNYFQQKVEDIKKEALNILENIRKKANEITENVISSVNEIVQSIDERIKKLTGEAAGVDVTECTNMAASIRDTGLAIITNSSKCVTNKVDQATEYIENITNICNQVFANLTVLSEQAHVCTKKIDSVEATLKSVVCLTGVLKDATVTLTVKIPAVVRNVSKLVWLAGTLVPSLTVCSVNSSVVTFVQDARDIMSNVEACVQQKINNFRSTTVAA